MAYTSYGATQTAGPEALLVRRLLATGATIGAGLLGGLLLGSYAVGYDQARQQAVQMDSSVAAHAPGSLTIEPSGPEAYVCKGCGPTLAERQADAYRAPYDEPGGHIALEDEAPPQTANARGPEPIPWGVNPAPLPVEAAIDQNDTAPPAVTQASFSASAAY